MHPPIPSELVAELAHILRAHAPEHSTPGIDVAAEWSQVAASHAGRMYLGGERDSLPSAATALFQQIHQLMRDSTHGAWFSARIEVPATAGEATFTPNYSQRVFWNSPSMLQPPTVAPIPADAEWTLELQRHPRAPEFVPPWIAVQATDTSEFTLLRESLKNAGIPTAAVRLPGETHPTFEGAILVRAVSNAFSVDVFDYGQLHHLGTAATERSAGLIAWNYLTAQMPTPLALSRNDVEQRAASAHAPYQELRQRILAAGPGGVVTNLAPGIPYDRWGTIDGLYLFAWATPTDQRALPPSAIDADALRVGVIANRPISVQAEITPSWFDQAGGGIRFRMPSPVRDLIRAGDLSVIVAAPSTNM